MSDEQLKAFIEKVQSDTSLQEKLKAAADANAVAAIAKEAGFTISADDLTKGQSEIEDAQLEGAAGGGSTAVGWPEGLFCALANGLKPRTTAPVPGGCPI